MFGKRLSEYLTFQKLPLGLIAAVGIARLLLSLAGLSDENVKWLSMNVVAWAAVAYYGVAVHRRGFGGYKQLLPLMVTQAIVQQTIAVVGILLSTAGLQNIYAAPEYSFAAPGQEPNQWLHVLAHLSIGMVVPVFIWWGVASLILLLTKRVSSRPSVLRAG